MTLDDLIQFAHTPLPGPPMLTQEQLDRLKASVMSMGHGIAGLVPDMALPMAPDWLLKYSAERGLLPDQVDGPGRGLPRGPGSP